MSEEVAPFAVWFNRNGDCIGIEVEVNTLDIRDAVFLRHQLDVAIRDFEKAAGR